MAVKVVTDSVSDVPPEVAQELGITVIPIGVRFGTETFRDGVDLSAEEFYHKLETSSFFPATFVLGLGEFVEIFDKVAEQTDEIIFIPLSSKLSATYEVALQARNQMNRNCRVEVVDSLSAIMGEGLIVIEAAKAAQRGENLDQIAATVKEIIPRTHVRACFDTLEYLRKGGRIGKAQALLGSILKVNPIVGIENDEVLPFAKARSRAKGMDWLYNFVKGFSHIKALAVEYATTPDEAEELAQRLGAIFPRDQICMSRVGCVVGTHVGPHVISVSLIEG